MAASSVFMVQTAAPQLFVHAKRDKWGTWVTVKFVGLYYGFDVRLARGAGEPMDAVKATGDGKSAQQSLGRR